MEGTEPSRREFLRRAGLGAAAVAVGGPALLAACSNPRPAATTVRVVNEPLSLDDNTAALFQSDTGVVLSYHEYSDPAAYLRQATPALRAHRDIGADVVILPDLQTAQMIEGGFVQPLPFRPKPADIVHAFANPRFDPGRRFSLPWSASMIGLAYDRRRVKDPVRSVGALFDSRYAGKVVLSADPAQTLGLAMLGLGLDPATVTPAQATAALQRVRTAVAAGQIRSFATTEYLDDVLAGRALVAIARSDEIRVAKQINPTLEFVVPSEGGMLESTNMVVPAGARDVSDARVFIRYSFKPGPNSRLASFASQVLPVTGADVALQGIDVKAALDPLVVPPPAVWNRLRIWGGTAATDAVTAQFVALAAAHAVA